MKTRTVDISGLGTRSLSLPELCPKCGKSFSPSVVWARQDDDIFRNESYGISAALACNGCDSLLVAHFTVDDDRTYQLDSCEPVKPTPRQFDDIVASEISADFVEIYNQAKAAEEYGLTHISGMGYRKALEFLVKDFAIKQDPSKEEKIKADPLGAVLKKYIDDKYVKQSAKAASWIGNDETHYQRKHEDKDINDLKRYLDSCLLFIMAIMNTMESKEMTGETSDVE